jgi:hypothetical protein
VRDAVLPRRLHPLHLEGFELHCRGASARDAFRVPAQRLGPDAIARITAIGTARERFIATSGSRTSFESTAIHRANQRDLCVAE